MRRSLQFTALILAAGFVPALAHAQTVDDIIAKNLKSKGGLEKLQATNTLKMSGTIVSQGNEMPLQVWSKRPNLFRREVEVQGQKIIQASDGKTVWMINPMMGSSAPQEVPADQAKVMQADADFDGVFVDYKKRGTTIELVGSEKLEGKDVYHLKVTPKGSEPQDYYLDATSGLEIKVARAVEQGGMKMRVETELSNYKEVDGLMVPFSTRQALNGTPIAQVTIEKVEFNASIEDAMFRMPVAAPK
jgi:outer membrane lipoprotein-sorting protein